MIENDAIVRERIDAALRETESFFVRAQLFIGGVGLLVILASLARGLAWLAAFGLVAFGGMVALMVFARRRTRDQPVRKIILAEPLRVTAIEHYVTSSSSGAFPSHWLRFRVGDQQLGLRFELAVIEALAPFLARTFVNAAISIPGFDASGRA
ncbi:hypothetical protein ACNOYE_13465 [Nannocystaceae bacterium ST9]